MGAHTAKFAGFVGGLGDTSVECHCGWTSGTHTDLAPAWELFDEHVKECT